jgi:uncharacterized membrane protein YjfL (UPF0719 family)
MNIATLLIIFLVSVFIIRMFLKKLDKKIEEEDKWHTKQ